MSDTVTTPSRQPRIFHGWYIVGIAVTSGMLLSGFQTYAFGFFFKPMSEELEFSRGATSAVLLIRAVIMGALALPIGMAVDRYGPRALMALGIIMAGLSTIGMAWVGSLLSFYLIFGVFARPSPWPSPEARSPALSSPSGSCVTEPLRSQAPAPGSRWAAS